MEEDQRDKGPLSMMRTRPISKERRRNRGMTLTQCMPVVGGVRSSYTPIRVAAVTG